MSYELKNRLKTYVWLQQVTWPKVLQLALAYDWQPQGVFDPRSNRRYRPSKNDLDKDGFTFIADGRFKTNIATGERTSVAEGANSLHEAEVKREMASVVSLHLAPLLTNHRLASPQILFGYLQNDRLVVTTPDAKALAQALEKGLSDVPTVDTIRHLKFKDGEEPAEDDGEIHIATGTFEEGLFMDYKVAAGLVPSDWFSGEAGRAKLKKVISLAAVGEFIIF